MKQFLDIILVCVKKLFYQVIFERFMNSQVLIESNGFRYIMFFCI